MKKVAGLAHSGGCNVLTTIHQPSSEVFHGFDKVRRPRKGEAPNPHPHPSLTLTLPSP